MVFVISVHLLNFDDSILLNNLYKEYPAFSRVLSNDYLYIYKLLNSNFELKDFLVTKYKKESHPTFLSKLRVYRQLIASYKEMEIFYDMLTRNDGPDSDENQWWVLLNKIDIHILNLEGFDMNKIEEVYNFYLDNKYMMDQSNDVSGCIQLLYLPSDEDKYSIDMQACFNEGIPMLYNFMLNESQFKILILTLMYHNVDIKTSLAKDLKAEIAKRMEVEYPIKSKLNTLDEVYRKYYPNIFKDT